MNKEEREVMRIALEAMNLAGGNLCETLNHSKKLQHKIGEPCPAVAKFDAAITAIEKCLANDAVDSEPVAWKLVPVEPTKEMLKAMDECSTEGYDERLYAGHAASVYMAAVDVAPTPPPVAEPHKRKPLSDEEIILIVAECASSHQHTDIHFARAIEQAHGIIAPTELKGEA